MEGGSQGFWKQVAKGRKVGGKMWVRLGGNARRGKGGKEQRELRGTCGIKKRGYSGRNWKTEGWKEELKGTCEKVAVGIKERLPQAGGIGVEGRRRGVQELVCEVMRGK